MSRKETATTGSLTLPNASIDFNKLHANLADPRVDDPFKGALSKEAAPPAAAPVNSPVAAGEPSETPVVEQQQEPVVEQAPKSSRKSAD